MGKRDPRIDAYIDGSAAFARPILKHLRRVVHNACPDVQETMKWSVPHFDYRGMLCSMASFKEHCAFGFWKGELVFEGRAQRDAMGHFGRITSLDDLPGEKKLAGYIAKAMKLNDDGVKAPRMVNRRTREALEPPAELLAALKKNGKALATFQGFSASNKRDYIEWIVGAKTDATRSKRLETALAWMSEGKSRNWKYL